MLLVTPTSDYNSDKLLNLGSNRWAIRPEIGVSRGLGKWSLELIGNVWLFGDNDSFFGGSSPEQAPRRTARRAQFLQPVLDIRALQDALVDSPIPRDNSRCYLTVAKNI